MADRKPNFKLEFYADAAGRQPALEWIRRDLSDTQKRAVGAALYLQLQKHGPGVCSGEYGKQLGGGLFELRIRHNSGELYRAAGQPARTPASAEKIQLRLFCHSQGDRVVVLFGGYDKGKDPSPRRQQREIASARSRLTAFRATQRASAAER